MHWLVLPLVAKERTLGRAAVLGWQQPDDVLEEMLEDYAFGLHQLMESVLEVPEELPELIQQVDEELEEESDAESGGELHWTRESRNLEAHIPRAVVNRVLVDWL